MLIEKLSLGRIDGIVRQSIVRSKLRYTASQKSQQRKVFGGRDVYLGLDRNQPAPAAAALQSAISVSVSLVTSVSRVKRRNVTLLRRISRTPRMNPTGVR